MRPVSSQDAIFTRLAGMEEWPPDLEALLAGVGVLCGRHPRMGIQQAIAFAYIALCNARFLEVTFTEVRERLREMMPAYQDKKSGSLLDGLLGYDGGLGWVEQRDDPDDRRRKWLALSYEGRMVAQDMYEAMKQARRMAEDRLPRDLEVAREPSRQDSLDLSFCRRRR